jgi:peptide/nickel transport system ATP-binding protein
VQKLVETRDLYTEFNTFEGVVHALNGVSVVVNEGETYGLVGESGCGKSVAVRSMMRIVQAPGRITDGKVVIFFRAEDRSRGIDIVRRSEAYMESIRGDAISMIFQEASTSLNPVLSIGYQIGESFHFHRRVQMLEETIRELDGELTGKLPPLARGWRRRQRSLFDRELRVLKTYEARIDAIDRKLYALEDSEGAGNAEIRRRLDQRRDRLREHDALVRVSSRVPFLRRYQRRLEHTVRRHVVGLLRSLGVANPERIADSHPHELSGGMQQRIVIAIALACHPVLLIADEPTSNLDVTIQAQIIDLIRVLKQTAISSVLFITHDLGLVAEICDRASVMYAGDIAETATVKELFAHPLHPYTQGLLRSVPQAEQSGELATIPGTVPNLITPPGGCRFHPRCPHRMELCAGEKPAVVEHSPGHWVACHLFSSLPKKGKR